MDAKNDDSAGSDSLDKSLQNKCVVDDVGQGEGASCSEVSKNARSRPDAKLPLHNSTKKLKTEHGAASISDSDGGGGGVEENAADGDQPNKNVETNNTEVNSTCSNNNSNAFETKVTQISKNLMDTTLAEGETQGAASRAAATAKREADEAEAATTLSDAATTSSTACSAETDKSNSVCSNDTNTQEEPPPSLANTDNESFDSQDPRSKKVRFHPDVKPNDGGKRVFKKKKKYKSTPQNDDDLASTSTGARPKRMLDEMELDDGEEEEEEENSGEEQEEEFDFNKTIAEAKDYLKQHPLSFVRPNDNERLLEPEDLPEPEEEETEEEEDFYQNVPPENGVERILGKLMGNGRVRN